MILGKMWRALMAQINKIANIFWTSDPIAQMQYEYDLAVNQLKEGREGLEQYRALVERVSRQVANDKQHVASLEAKVKAYLTAGDRETAARFALELQKAKQDQTENEGQLKLHEESYGNNVTEDQARDQETLRRPRKNLQVRRRIENEPGRSRNGEVGHGFQFRRHHRFRANRTGNPG